MKINNEVSAYLPIYKVRYTINININIYGIRKVYEVRYTLYDVSTQNIYGIRKVRISHIGFKKYTQRFI